MGNNNSKQNKEINETNLFSKKKIIPSEYNNIKEKIEKSKEYLNLYYKTEDIIKKKDYIKKAININNNDKDIVIEYLKTISKENIYSEELQKYQIIFTPEEIKSNKFPINKIKNEKIKLIEFFENIFTINTKDKEQIKELLNNISYEYKNIIHFKLPITYENKELYYYKNFCLLLDMFNYLGTDYNRIYKIELLQNFKDKIKELFKYLEFTEKLTDFIFLLIFSFNDKDNFEDCYYRIIDNFLEKKYIQKEIDNQKENLLLKKWNIKYNMENDTIIIFDEKKEYFMMENFSLYSPYLVLNNLYFYDNKIILKEKYKIGSLRFNSFYENDFYIKYKKKIYQNFKKIINTKIIKDCIKIINSLCPEYFIDNLAKYFEISDSIENYIDIYPFESQLGVTDKYSMKIYLKGIISFNYNIINNNYIELVKNLYMDAYFNILFIHEFCGHFFRVYIYYMLNNDYLFYTPRLNIEKKNVKESGNQMEYLLFKKLINMLKFPEIVYIININNYSKNSIMEFNDEFTDEQFLFENVKYYKGEYEDDINNINIINEYLYHTNIVFTLKKNYNMFEIGMCSTLFRQ
jgi:hypothetical protein